MQTCNTVFLDQLLSLRDSEPVEACVAQHVSTCAACAGELERLRSVRSMLQSLPLLTAPSHGPPMHTHAPAQSRLGMVGFAAAASISAIALLIFLARHPDRASDTATQSAIPSLVIRSQDLESQLRRLPSRPVVERAGTTTAIDSLQNTIQLVDYQLSFAEASLTEQQATQLWQDRIQLMDSLVKVRYAEAQRFSVLQ